MKLFIENEVNADLGFDFYEIAKRLIDTCLDYEAFPFDVMVEVSLVDNQTIHEINLEQRGIDRSTDVLSFPMISYPAPGDYSFVEEDDSNFDPEDGLAMLGDIVISVDKIKEQAKEYGHSELREYAFLLVHSMLHLLGYDHEDENEAEDMFGRQEEILTMCGITRDRMNEEE